MPVVRSEIGRWSKITLLPQTTPFLAKYLKNASGVKPALAHFNISLAHE